MIKYTDTIMIRNLYVLFLCVDIVSVTLVALATTRTYPAVTKVLVIIKIR